MAEIEPDPDEHDQDRMSSAAIVLVAVVCSLVVTAILLIGWYLGQRFF